MDDSSFAKPLNFKKFLKHFYWLLSQGTFFPALVLKFFQLQNGKKDQKNIMHLMSLVQVCFCKA